MIWKYRLATVIAVLGQFSDCVTTQVALSMGAKEANPIMQGIVKHFWLGCLIKIGFALLFARLCYKREFPRPSGAWTTAMVGIIGFVAAIWNFYNILQIKYR